MGQQNHRRVQLNYSKGQQNHQRVQLNYSKGQQNHQRVQLNSSMFNVLNLLLKVNYFHHWY